MKAIGSVGSSSSAVNRSLTLRFVLPQPSTKDHYKGRSPKGKPKQDNLIRDIVKGLAGMNHLWDVGVITPPSRHVASGNSGACMVRRDSKQRGRAACKTAIGCASSGGTVFDNLIQTTLNTGNLIQCDA